MSKIYWTMRDGKQIDVDDMNENHLRNTLKMLLRNNRVKKKKKGNIEQQFQNAREDGMTECYFDIH